MPLISLHATVTDPVLSAALTTADQERLITRITDVREAITALAWPLGTGLIHGDAWAGNLLACPGAPRQESSSVTGTGSAPDRAKST